MTRSQIDALRAEGQSKGWTFTVGENPATAIPLEQLCGLKVPENWEATANFVDLDQAPMDLPASYDWRALGGVTPIRNQGNCGSCWAFSTVGALECAIKIKDSMSVNLSEQWLVSCNREGWGCDGGFMAHDYHQWKTDACGGTGAVYESDFPYTATDAPCGCPYAHPYRITSWAYIGSSGGVPSTNSIKQAIMDYGPVSVAIYVNSAFQGYTGGVFNACSSGQINHAVVLVGWDDNQGGGVWFLRNSWGTGWGESGYMKITYGCCSVGYAACYIMYPGFDPLNVSPNDGLSSTGEVGGPFAPQCKTYALKNNGTSSLNWTGTKTQNWLDVAPASGTLAAGASVDANVCVNGNANSLPIGTYTDQVVFTNTTNGKTQTRDVSLKVGHVDYYTELFTTNNDLGHMSLTFAPDGSAHYYAACKQTATAFPTDPSSGVSLAVSGDNYVKVTLAGGANVYIYGQAYSDFYVGANGYITFGGGDTDATETLADHFRLKRLSGLFTDLNPGTNAVTWKQLLDRAVVTFQNVPEVGTSGGNNFQIEMFYDGRIRMTWLDIAVSDGLAGLSQGMGTPSDYQPSDLTGYSACPPAAHHRADFDGDGDVDLGDFGHFQACLTRVGVFVVNPPCADMDFDEDGDVDRTDFQKFRQCLSGSEVSVAGDCLSGSP
jgi:hypothetical protein